MSGGSLGYLCCAETRDLFDRLSDMQEVEENLLSRGYDDIARDVRRLIEYCKTSYNRIDVLREQLKDVFHDVEWRLSSDYGEDTLIKGLEKYRNER